MGRIIIKLLACLSIILLWQQIAAAAPAEIEAVHVVKSSGNGAGGSGYAQVEFVLSKSASYHAFTLSDSPRVVIDINNAVMEATHNRVSLSNTPIKNIRSGQHDGGVLRVVLDVEKLLPYHVGMSVDKKLGKARLLVQLGSKPQAASKAPAAKTEVEQSHEDKAKANQLVSKPVLSPQPQTQSAPIEKKAATLAVPVLPLPVKNNSLPISSSVPVVTKVPASIPAQASESTSVPTSTTPTSSASILTAPPEKMAPANSTSSSTDNTSKNRDPRASIALLDSDTKQQPQNFHGRDIVIVIDPGHGGKDPGAHGVASTKEKDVVLAIAKDVQNYLNQQNGFSAVLTRDGDYYVGLHERLHIAHVNKADMFLSLHADAYKSSLVKGTTVFALAANNAASSEKARWLAERENVSEMGGTSNNSDSALHSILLDLSQKVVVQTSLLMADNLLNHLAAITKIHTHRIEQAGFIVLQAPDIPSLLVETGFISDVGDEAKLRDPQYQKQFAVALGQGIMEYFTQHPPNGTVVARLSAQAQHSAV